MAKPKPKRPQPKPKKAAVVARRTTVPDQETGQTAEGWENARFEAALWAFGLLGQYKDEVHVNNYTALTYSVVWRCLVYISQTIAGFGWDQFEGTPGKPGKQPVYDDLTWILDTQASPEMSSFEWRQVMLLTAASRGNSYSEIERDGFGRPQWLWYIDADRVSLGRNGSGELYYSVDNGVGEEPTNLRPDQMFHLRGPGPDGLTGYSVIGLARKAIRLGLQTEQYGDTYFRRGPMPGGILEVPGAVKKEERDSMRESFEKAYGGSKNAGKVVVATGGIKFNPLSLPNEDAQFIESRKFQVNEICRWFGLPPHKVFDLERATFSNIEQQSIEVVQDCLLPWCRRLESEADIKLFGRVMRGRRWTRINMSALLRGDSTTQTTNLVSQVNTGLLTPDEARDHLDCNPYPDGLGKTPIVQGAMISLETAIDPPEPPEPPQPAGEPAQGGAGPAQDGGKAKQPPKAPAQNGAPAAQVVATFQGLLADAYGRLLRVETDKAKRAENKGQLAEHAKAYYNTPEHITFAAGLIEPIIEALFLASGRKAEQKAAFYADLLACNHLRQSQRDLESGIAGAAGWDSRPATQAARDIGRVWERLT